MADKERERLLAQVRQLQRRASNKVSRIRTVNGIEIGGTDHDVRRDPKKTKNYNKTQLRSFIGKLENFNSRSNNFVQGAEGAVIPKKQWNEYKAVERKYNSIGQRINNSVLKTVMPKGSETVPGSGMTIKQRRNTLKPDNPRSAGAAVAGPYAEIDRKPSRVKSSAALAKLTEALKKKIDPTHLDRELKRGRKEMRQMLIEIGAADLLKEARKLTDEQFNVVWNETNFADAISTLYYHYKNKNSQTDQNTRAANLEDYRDDAKSIIEWGLKIQPPKLPNRTKK